MKIFYGWGITLEDNCITYTFPISFGGRYSILVTTDYTAIVSGTTVPPITWVGNCSNKSNVTVFGNSSFLAGNTQIYFKILGIGY